MTMVPRLRKDRTCSARNRGTTPDRSIVRPPDIVRCREITAPTMPAMAAKIPMNVSTRNGPPLAPPKISATTLTMKIRGDIRRPRIPPISPNAKVALTNRSPYECYMAGKVLAYWRMGFSLVSALLASPRDGSYINGPRERV